jgi:hypothetical protein
MGAIVIGLRPGDHKRLEELAQVQGRPPQELAGIYLERAIRRGRTPAEGARALPADDRLTVTGSPATREPV